VIEGLARGVRELASSLGDPWRPGDPPDSPSPEDAYRGCLEGGRRYRLVVSCRSPRGRGEGPLSGVPLAYKDNMDYPGEPTRCGSRAVFSTPRAPARAVALLESMGAVPVARASMDEMGLSTTGYNTVHGTAVNPLDPSRIVGGSTSGGAGLVALWGGGLAVGTDAGGSVRIPAAFTGLYSLRLRRGDASLEGVAVVSRTMESLGVIAATPEVAALAVQALAPGEALRAGVLVAAWESGAWSPVVVVPRGYEALASPEVRDAFEDALSTLESRGVRVEWVEWGALWRLDRARAVITLSEAYQALASRLGQAPEGLRRILEEASRIPAWLYSEALALIGEARERAASILGGRLLALPTTPIPPPPREEAERLAYSRKLIAYTGIANALDLSSATIPLQKRLERIPASIMLSSTDTAAALASMVVLSRELAGGSKGAWAGG